MANQKKNTNTEVDFAAVDAKPEQLSMGVDAGDGTVSETKENIVPETKEQQSIDELRAQNAKLQDQINQLMQMIKSSSVPQQSYTPTPTFMEEVTVVHLVERAPGLSTYVKLSNLELSMSKFGEERTIDRRQAEELVGGHRKLFEEGILAFGKGGEDIARRMAVKSVSDYGYITDGFVAMLGKLSPIELETLYSKLCEGHQKFVVEYFKRQIIAKRSEFMDPGKIDVLNRLSGRAMFDVLLDKQRDDVNAQRK